VTDRSTPPLPAAVLWDMDGTLVDTEPYWIAAEYAIVAEYGGQWSDELAHQIVGNPLLVSAEFILANSPVSMSPDELVEALLERVVARVTECVPWRPGARELLDDLRAHQRPLRPGDDVVGVAGARRDRLPARRVLRRRRDR
jgi:beta-phosphoglucomutase-like phosphatase (HAD superfamily)